MVKPLRSVAHYGRRVRGRVQLRGLTTSGTAPTAVLTALRHALHERPSPEEAAWIRQIEQLRRSLLASSEPLEMVDFGAGPAHRFDTGEYDTANIARRTLGKMTRSSKPPRWAYLLFRLVRELRPENVLELGACVGISACYQAAALQLNGGGRLVTLEGASVLAARSATSIKELGLEHRASVTEGRFTDVLDDVLDDLDPVELAFVDGHHVEAATLDYAERIMTVSAEEAVFIFDDIHWSRGMTRAWSAIAADPRFSFTLDLQTLGIAVISASAVGLTRRAVSYA